MAKLMRKWLIIMVTVITTLAIILLILGFLLTENKSTTVALKNQLAQQALNLSKQSQAKVKEDLLLSPFEQSRQQIISAHLACESDRDCFVIETEFEEQGCLAVVNAVGLAILLKVAHEKKY